MSKQSGAEATQTEHVRTLQAVERGLIRGGATVPEICGLVGCSDKTARRYLGALGALGLRIKETRVNSGPSVFRGLRATAVFRSSVKR